MKKIIFGTGTVLISFFFPACNCHESPVKNSANLNSKGEIICSYSHQLSRGYLTLYPPGEELFYTKIQITDSLSSHTAGFLFHFANTFSNFRNYEFRQDSGIPVQSTRGEFNVKFNKHVTEDTYSILYVNVNSNGEKTKTFEMHLSFDPKVVQERNGRSVTKDGLLIRKTEVRFLEVPTGDFIANTPADGEKQFLINEFGQGIKNTSTETEKIRILAAEVLDLLEPFRGIPGNEMDTLSAVGQMMLLKKNKEKVYCKNISEIFLATCLSFGIPGRRIGLGNTYDDSKDPAIFHSDYHSTVEVFNKDVQSWVLVDLSFYLLEAKMDDGRILNFIDFLYLLNSPEEREKMSVFEYDPMQKKVNMVNVSKSGNFDKLMDFYKQNQKFYFQHKKGFFTF